jgi:modulator of FtsH protease HflC
MRKVLLRWCLPALLLLWGRTALCPVDAAEFAYVTRFGEPVGVYDGATESGLHWKLPWPIDSVRTLDRRLQVLDLPAIETLTRDAGANTVDKTLAVDAYLLWRVPDSTAADKFLRTLGTPERARQVLTPRINARLAAVVGQLPLDAFLSVAKPDELDLRTQALRRELLADDLPGALAQEFGIEVVDLRVRRVSYPEAVRGSIAERIRSERQRKVADYESDGRRKAADIATAADRDARIVEATARANKAKIEGEADAEADRLRAEAAAADPEFYAFLAKLRAFRTMVSESRDVLLLSTKHPLFELLLAPPKPAAGKAK